MWPRTTSRNTRIQRTSWPVRCSNLVGNAAYPKHRTACTPAGCHTTRPSSPDHLSDSKCADFCTCTAHASNGTGPTYVCMVAHHLCGTKKEHQHRCGSVWAYSGVCAALVLLYSRCSGTAVPVARLTVGYTDVAQLRTLLWCCSRSGLLRRLLACRDHYHERTQMHSPDHAVLVSLPQLSYEHWPPAAAPAEAHPAHPEHLMPPPFVKHRLHLQPRLGSQTAPPQSQTARLQRSAWSIAACPATPASAMVPCWRAAMLTYCAGRSLWQSH